MFRRLTAPRPSLEKLLIDAQNGNFDGIAITEIKVLHYNRKKRNEILDLLRNIDILIIPKPRKKAPQKNEPRQIKWIPDPAMSSLFEVMAGKKTIEEHESQFGISNKD